MFKIWYVKTKSGYHEGLNWKPYTGQGFKDMVWFLAVILNVISLSCPIDGIVVGRLQIIWVFLWILPWPKEGCNLD